MELRKALEYVWETSKTFHGGSQVTAENNSLLQQEMRDYFEARRVARDLGATGYQLQLALKGEFLIY